MAIVETSSYEKYYNIEIDEYGQSPHEWQSVSEHVEEKLLHYKKNSSGGGINSKDYSFTDPKRSTKMSKGNNLMEDTLQWTKLPPYDKSKGNSGISTKTILRRDTSSGREEKITQQIPWYSLSLPPIPTPVIYTKAPWTDEDDEKEFKSNSSISNTGVEVYDRVLWNNKTIRPTYSNKHGILTDVKHNADTMKLVYRIELENGQTMISDTVNHIEFLNWPPSGQYDKSEIGAFDVNTLMGTSHEYLLVENPDIAESHGIDISKILHKYKK